MTNFKMSKVFGHSMKSVGFSAGLLREDNERFIVESNSALRNNNVNAFLKPSIPSFVSERNAAIKSRLFSHNVDSYEGFEEISRISFESTTCQNVNEPSTSGTSAISNIVHKNHKALNAADHRLNTYQDSKMFFCPAARETLLNSRMRFMHSDCHTEKKNDRVLQTKKFDPMPKNFSIHSSRLPQNAMSLQNFSSLNSNSSVSFNNKINVHGIFNSDTVERNFPQEKNFDINLSLKKFGSKNDIIKKSVLSREEIRHNTYNEENFNSYNMKNIVENKSTDGYFLKSFSKLNSGSVTLPSKQFNQNHLKSHAISNSQIDSNILWRFKSNHIPSRKIHPFSDLEFLTRQNQLEIKSTSGIGSVISVDEVYNLLEGLQHSVLNSLPNLEIDEFKERIKCIKEAVKNKSEFSFVHTVKENENASDISYSSKVKGLKEKPLDTSFTLKSGKDILKELVSKNKNQMSQVLFRIEEEKSVIKNLDIIDWSEEEKEDSALLFKKPKPVLRTHKRIPKIKTPQKNFESNSFKKIINLKNWYPVASEKDLFFCGTLENGTFLKTEAVQKRITNRKIMLMNGLECNLIGPPFDTTVSVFPKKILAGLKDGLKPQWKNFHQQLWEYQCFFNEKNMTQSFKKDKIIKFEKVKNKIKLGNKKKKELKNNSAYDTTPVGRKISPVIKNKGGKKIQSNSKIIITKTNIKKSFGCSKKNSRFKSTPKTKNNNSQIESIEKDVKISPTSPETNDCVENVSRTRSGRAFRLPGFFDANEEKEINLTPSGRPKRLLKCNYSDSSLHSKKSFILKDSGVNVKNRGEETPCGLSSTVAQKCIPTKQLKRKRENIGEPDSFQRKKSKVEKILLKSPALESSQPLKAKSKKNISKKLVENNKKITKSVKNIKKKSEKTRKTNIEDDLQEKWTDIEIPHAAKVSEKLKLNRSQLRLVCTETPPLKYFNNNLKLLKSSPTVPSPEWCISHKTKAEVNQYQIKQAYLKKKKNVTKSVDEKKSTTKKKKNSIKNKDLKTMLNWVADETVKTPAGKSKLLRYMIPSRKEIELKGNSDAEEDGEDGDFFY